MNTTTKKITAISLAAIIIFVPFLVSIQSSSAAVEFDPGGKIKEKLKLPSGDVKSSAIKIVQWVLGFLSLIAVILIIYGGFIWMTAAGNEERITKAKNILKNAVIGLLVVMLSWAIVTFVFRETTRLTDEGICQGPCPPGQTMRSTPPCICQ